MFARAKWYKILVQGDNTAYEVIAAVYPTLIQLLCGVEIGRVSRFTGITFEDLLTQIPHIRVVEIPTPSVWQIICMGFQHGIRTADNQMERDKKGS